MVDDVRAAGLSGFAASSILRIELVSVEKENPTKLKLNVTGIAAFLFVGIFGGTFIYQQMGAQECVAQAQTYGRDLTRQIFDQAKLQGTYTPALEDSFARTQDLVEASIAACHPQLKDLVAGLTEGAEIALREKAGNGRRSPRGYR